MNLHRLPFLAACVMTCLLGCGGDDEPTGAFQGSFECTNFDTDLATLTIDEGGSSGTLEFVPSASPTPVATELDNLEVTSERVTFDATFAAVPDEDAPLAFSFLLNVEDDGNRLDGTGMLAPASGTAESCDATFSLVQAD